MVEFATIKTAIEAVARGEMIVVVDDEHRENEGDIVIAGGAVNPAAIAFMMKHARGLVCVSLPGERLDELDIPLMVARNSDSMNTAFTVSVDVIAGTTTGISAADRAATVKALLDPNSKPEDFARPGHMFPLSAHPQGVLGRPGHTEAAVDLARLAGLPPCGVICEVANDDGTMARLPQLRVFAREHGLQIVSIEDLIAFRRSTDQSIKRVSETTMPTKHGNFTTISYWDPVAGVEHVAVFRGNTSNARLPVRVHSECGTGDAVGSFGCNCGEQLDNAIQLIGERGSGCLVHLRRQQGCGISIDQPSPVRSLHDNSQDTLSASRTSRFDADGRAIAATILQDLGILNVEQLGHDHDKTEHLYNHGFRSLKWMQHPWTET